MMRIKRVSILAECTIIAVLLIGCQSQQTLPEDPVPGINVEISSDQCPTIEVRSGEQVTWTNTDKQAHILRHTPDDGNPQFVAGDIQPGDSFSFLFIETGTYPYECSEGTGNRGVVVVSP